MTKASAFPVTPVVTASWRGTRYEPSLWSMLVSECGGRCRFDVSQEGHCYMEYEQAGEISVRNVEMGWQSMERGTGFAKSHLDQNITVLAVRRGTLVVEDQHQTVSLKAGDMVMLDDALKHTLLFKEPALCSSIQIPPQVLSDRGMPARLLSGCNPVHANPESTAVRDLFLTFCAHASSAGEIVRERVARQFLDLMDIVVRSSDASHHPSSSEGVLLRARQLIARHLGDPDLSLTKMAGQLNVSSSSLLRAFKDRGLSPMRLVNLLRLERASQLLSGAPHMPVQEVAACCGFANFAHFSRSFKKLYGLAPREYAKLHGHRSELSLRA